MKGKLNSGKLPPELLGELLSRWTGADSSAVKVGPAVGEDAAVIQWKAPYLVVASDPITGATKGAGRLLVDVNANDVVCKGGVPQFMVVTVIYPSGTEISQLRSLMDDLSTRAKELGIAVVGGHTEANDGYPKPVLSATMIGSAQRVLSAKDIQEGDLLLFTKTAGLEGMTLLAHDRPDLLKGVLTSQEIEEVKSWGKQLSVLPEGLALAPFAKFMHDPTEGGYGGGLRELMTLADKDLIPLDPLPIHPYTKRAASALGFDPEHLIASGSLLAVIDPKDLTQAKELLEKINVPFAVVGKFTGERPKELPSSKEELWDLLSRKEV